MRAALICGGALPARHMPSAGTTRPWRLAYCTRCVAALLAHAACGSFARSFAGAGVCTAPCSVGWLLPAPVSPRGGQQVRPTSSSCPTPPTSRLHFLCSLMRQQNSGCWWPGVRACTAAS